MKMNTKGGLAALLALSAIGAALSAPIGAQAQRGRTPGYYQNSRVSMEQIRRLVDRAENTSNEFRAAFERLDRDRYDYRDDRQYPQDPYYRDDRYYQGDRDYRYRRDDRDDRYYRQDPNYRQDPYYRDDRSRWNDRYRRDDRSPWEDRYGRTGRYGRDDYYGGRSYEYLKQTIQRLDEGLEHLNGEVDDRQSFSHSRATFAEVMRNARIVDSSMRGGRLYGSSHITSLWARLRSDLNQLANIYGVSRI